MPTLIHGQIWRLNHDKFVETRQRVEANWIIGRKATNYGSDDELILLSGGPKSHLAQFSILAGPTKKRVIIRQPNDSELDAEENYNPLMEDIKLHHRRVPVIGEIEEWKHGSWYHSNKIFCEDLPTLLEKLGDYSGDEIADIGDIGPQRSFWVTSLSYDLVQFTQPIKLQNKPNQDNLLGIFWLIENWIIEESNGLSAFGLDKDWVRKTTEVIENLEDVPNFEPKQITSRITDIESSHDDEAHVQEIEKILESIKRWSPVSTQSRKRMERENAWRTNRSFSQIE